MWSIELRLNRYLFGALVAVVFHSSLAGAQDSHYWDNQYGTRSELLGGLVVGSPTDLSSTFYNPGWIALQNMASVLVTTKAVEAYEIKAKESIHINPNPSSSTFTSSPGYFAARFSLGLDDGWKWAYTYLQKVKFEYFSRAVFIDSNPNPQPGENYWSANESFRILMTDESWYGVSISRKLSDNVGLGFTPFGAYRNGISRSQVTSNNLRSDQLHADASLLDEYSYWNLRLLMKIGLGVETENWTAGLALTTPSLRIMGSGEVQQRVSFTGDYDPNNPGEDPPFLSADHQSDLASEWKSPLSVAAGMAYQIGRSKVHVTCEWFNHVAKYNILSPESYQPQSRPNVSVDYELTNAAHNVINYGLGIERAFTDRFSLYGSYRMDRTSSPKSSSTALSLTNWDLQHISTGASFNFLKIEFTIGLQYSWGGSVADRLVTGLLASNGDVIDNFDDLEYEYRRIKALLGFNLPFGKADDDL